MSKNNVFRYACDVEGFTDAWIEFDTSEWGIAEILDIPYIGHIERVRKYVPLYATNWHVKGVDGAVVPFPKSKEYDLTWELALKRLGPQSRNLWVWFGDAVVAALNEVIMPPKSGAEASG
jgi:hypothetical protein